jgi:putative ABC transport system permease protein
MLRPANVSDWRAVLAGAFAQNRLRTAIAVLAIALGVALGFAVQLINGSAVDALAQSVRTVSGDADLVVRGPRSGFDEALFVRLARDPEVAVASPAVEVEARLVGRSDSLRVIGLDLFRAAAIQPGLVADAGSGLDMLRPDTIFLSAAALAALGIAVDGTLALQVGLGEARVRVAGQLAGAADERIAAMDIAGAQVLFERLGRLSRIDLRLRPGVDLQRFVERHAAALPAGVAIDRPEASLAATESVSRSYRVNLNVLALVALFTGGLLVFSTQALGVVRRRAQFALLRVLGVTRGRLAALVALEGALIGACGATLGVVAGYAIARTAVRVAGSDLGAGFFRGVLPSIRIDPWVLATFFALGVAAALLGSVVPAREAARAAPARALKAGDEETALARLRSPKAGLALFALGALLVAVPPIDGLPLAGYTAIACLLVGALLLLPWLASQALVRVPTPVPFAPALALAQLRGAPGQVAVSLASIVAAVSLMVSMAIMVTSFRTSLDAWLGRVLPAELYFRTPAADSAFLAPADRARIEQLDGVARVEFMREEQLLLDAARPRVVLLARPLVERDAATRLPLVEPPRTRPPGAPPPAWVNEAMVDLFDFRPGRVVTLPIAGRAVPFFVAGVWRDYGRPHGAVQIEEATWVALTGDRSATNGAVWLAPGAHAAAVRDAIRETVPGGDRLEIALPGEIRALSLAAFDRTFAVTYALELAAVAIGLMGLSSAFGALVVARRREFGVLRHLGMTRRQVGAMLATEGAATAGLGVGVGTALGAAISLILIYVVNRQSFHWGMELAVPWGNLALFGVAVVALATVTAMLSGRQAMGADAVRAVKEDW